MYIYIYICGPAISDLVVEAGAVHNLILAWELQVTRVGLKVYSKEPPCPLGPIYTDQLC